MSKVLVLVLFCLPNICLAICLNPVPQQYIIVTSNPNDFNTTNKSHEKTNAVKWIYNHQSSQAGFKTQSSVKNIIPLQFSTLVLQLDPNELQRIKNLSHVQSVEQDCYVDINEVDDNLDLSSDNLNSENVPISSQTFEDEQNEVSNTSNDPLFEYQKWYFDLTQTFEKTLNTHTTVLIAVSDTGFEYTHSELEKNLWVNTQELNGRKGIDDDSNKCIDDINGCDLTTSNGDISPNIYRANYFDHGTHVAGIIGAEQNNERGIYGVASNSKLMLLKSFSSQRGTTSSDLMKSVYFAVDNGAEIINCSWGVKSTPSLSEFLAFEYARKNDVLAVVAAGNDNIYASKTSPAGLSNVLTVGSINSQKEISTFSNYGDAVDIYAPGGDKTRLNEFIWSTVTSNRYEGKRGTSMAAPFVTGVLANVKSAYPQATRNELINLLFKSSQHKLLRAYFEPSHTEDSLILNTLSLYQLAEEYFAQNDRYLNYEPKEIKKPNGSGHISSSSFEDYNFKSAGCGRRLNQKFTEPSSIDAKFSISLLLLLLPVTLVLAFKFRFKKARTK